MFRKQTRRPVRSLAVWRKVLIALTAASFLGVIGVQSPVSAGGVDRMQIAGVGFGATPGEGTCDAQADLALEMTGSLIGCLSIFVDRFKCHVSPDGIKPDRYVERGRETFIGVLDTGDGERHGTFGTTYVVRATMAPNSGCDFDQQLTGGCVHRLVRQEGTGVFDEARGLILFNDRIPDPPGPAADFPYQGLLKLHR